MGSGLADLHMKDALPGRRFSVSKNQLALGGSLSRVCKVPDVQISE